MGGNPVGPTVALVFAKRAAGMPTFTPGMIRNAAIVAKGGLPPTEEK